MQLVSVTVNKQNIEKSTIKISENVRNNIFRNENIICAKPHYVIAKNNLS